MAGQDGIRFFVPNLPPTVGDEEMQQHFSKYGQLTEACAARDKAGAPRGFGYVTLAAGCSPDAVLNDVHPLGGAMIRVNLTKETLAGCGKKVHLNDCAHLSVDDIREAFSVFGQVWDVHTPKDPNTGERKRFAFVTFGSDDAYQRAVATGSYAIGDRSITIKPAAATDGGFQAFGKGGGKDKGFGKDSWSWGGKGYDSWGASKGGNGYDQSGWGGKGGKSGAGYYGGKGGGPAAGIKYFVTNVPQSATEADLMQHFSKYGNVVSANMMMDKGIGPDGQSGQRAYITMQDEANRDIILGDRHEFQGNLLSIMLSKENLLGSDTHKVHVDNCQNASAEQLRETFSIFGAVLDVHAPKDFHTGERKRFGFVTFSTEEAMNAAISQGMVVIGQDSLPIKASARGQACGKPDGKGKGKGCWDSKGGKGKGSWDGSKGKGCWDGSKGGYGKAGCGMGGGFGFDGGCGMGGPSGMGGGCDMGGMNGGCGGMGGGCGGGGYGGMPAGVGCGGGMGWDASQGSMGMGGGCWGAGGMDGGNNRFAPY